MLRLTLLFFVFGIASVFGLAESDLEDRGYRGHTIRVRHGQSIQKAVNKARRGTRIVVEAGTYAEQVTIRQDGITLIGKGATITPPDYPVHNPCSDFAGPGTQAGICIVGKGLKLGEFKTEHKQVFKVHRPVHDVTVTGFHVEKFQGFNILVLGAEDTHVYDNKLTDGGVYGFLTAGSINTHVEGNVISSTQTGIIALCMDNFAKVKVTGNSIDNYFIGLCIQTNGAEVKDNKVTNTCAGAFIDPGVKYVDLCSNKIIKSLPDCGPKGSSGIALDGAIKAKVLDNFVAGFKNGGKGSGLALIDDPCEPDPTTGAISLSCLKLGGKPAISYGNLVKGNKFKDNDIDIYKNTKGKGNEIRWNQCKTSFPEKLCRAHRG